jgi:uncharacterized membrane protein
MMMMMMNEEEEEKEKEEKEAIFEFDRRGFDYETTGSRNLLFRLPFVWVIYKTYYIYI